MEYLQVGKISNTHGNKGHVKVVPLMDDIRSFDELDSVYIGMDKELYSIENVAYQKGQALIKLKGIDSLRDAEDMMNSFLWVKTEDVEKPEGAHFLFEIIGLKVYDRQENYIGKIIDVLQPGANDVYVVKGENGESLIPAVKEIVVDVDIEDKKMIIDPLEGMIE